MSDDDLKIVLAMSRPQNFLSATCKYFFICDTALHCGTKLVLKVYTAPLHHNIINLNKNFLDLSSFLKVV